MNTRIHGMISFGLINIPVGVATAITGTNEIKFRQLHNCGKPISDTTPKPATKKKKEPEAPEKVAAVKRTLWCTACGVEVTNPVRGYEYQPGVFAMFTDEELATTEPPKTTAITLNKFVPAPQLKRLMSDKPYYLVPAKNVPGGYGLLYQSLSELKLVGIGKQSLWGKEHPCAIVPESHPTGGVLMLYTLNLREDIVDPDFSSPIPDKEEKKIAKEIITSLRGDLDDSDLVSGQRVRLNDLITAKLAGRKVTVAQTAEPTASTDLMASLKATLAEQQKKKEAAQA